ncbi:hypothetical protein [Streptomyces sp. NPDC014623]|uniref:hypothetical protein n=1 Tax=Streptomyces sp. NPDC014623 TaxID=3364875 RepID=UPI0036FFC997
MTDTAMTEREPLEVARDAIPGFRAVQAADTILQERITELRSSTSRTPVDLGAETFEAITSGKPIPDHVGRRAWEAQQADVFRDNELQVLLGVAKRLQNHGENTARAGADHGLRALRPVLDELLDQARPMAAALCNVHDAQTAIDRGPDAVAAWSGFADVISRYNAIRSAQHTITRMAIGQDVATKTGHIGFNTVFNVWSEIQNVTEVWPEWTPTPHGEHPIRPPWPASSPNRPFHVQHDREWLMWLLTNPTVRPWVPTIGELKKAYEDQREEAAKRDGEAPKTRTTGEPRRIPTRHVNGDGDAYVQFQTIEG